MTDEEIIAAADACGLMLFGLGMDKAKFEFCILAFAKFVGKIERFKEQEPVQRCVRLNTSVTQSGRLVHDTAPPLSEPEVKHD